jgi:hypothetical protein
MARTKLLSALVLLATVAGAQTAKPTPDCPAPIPHVHIGEDGNPSASCPKGWQVHISPAAADAYNKIRTRDAAINMLADAPCVRGEDKPAPKEEKH